MEKKKGLEIHQRQWNNSIFSIVQDCLYGKKAGYKEAWFASSFDVSDTW